MSVPRSEYGTHAAQTAIVDTNNFHPAKDIRTISLKPDRPLRTQQDRLACVLQGLDALESIPTTTVPAGLSHLRQPNQTLCLQRLTVAPSQIIATMRAQTDDRLITLDQPLSLERHILRKSRLQQRLHRLDHVELELNDADTTVIGVLGWGEQCLIKLPKQSNVSQYDALICQNKRDGRLFVRYFDNPFIEDHDNEKGESLRCRTDGVITHTNQTIVWQTIQEIIKRHNDEVTSGSGNAATVGCCTQVSLDEIASALTGKEATHHGQGASSDNMAEQMIPHEGGANEPSADMAVNGDGGESGPSGEGMHADANHNAGGHHHGSEELIGLPQTPMDTGFALAVGYISLAGAYIGLKTIRGHYKQLITEICQSLDKTYRELNKLALIESTQRKREHSERRKVLEARVIFISRQLKESLFQLHAAGHLSGASSTLMFFGQFMPMLQPIALFGNTLVGLAHVVNSVRNFLLTNADQRRLELYEQRQTADYDCRKETACERLQAISPEPDARIESRIRSNRVALRFMQDKQRTVLKNIVSWSIFTLGAAAVTTAMISMLGVSVVFPPALLFVGLGLLIPGIVGTTLYNNRLTNNQYNPGLPLRVVNTEVTEEVVQQALLKAEDLRQETEALKKTATLKHGFRDRLKHQLARWGRYKIVTLFSIGILSPALLGQKSVVKGIRARDTNLSHDNVTHYLKHFLNDSNDAPQQEGDESDIAYYRKLLTVGDFVSDNQLAEQFGKLVGQISMQEKVVATKLEMRSLSKGLFRLNRIKETQLSDKFAPLFAGIAERDEVLEDLKTLKHAKPCCAHVIEAQSVLQNINLTTPENQALFKELLYRYLLFQAEKDAGRNIPLWSEYWACFRTVS